MHTCVHVRVYACMCAHIYIYAQNLSKATTPNHLIYTPLPVPSSCMCVRKYIHAQKKNLKATTTNNLIPTPLLVPSSCICVHKYIHTQTLSKATTPNHLIPAPVAGSLFVHMCTYIHTRANPF